MSDTNPIVSVIVPAYNVERFLDQALASVEAQTLRELEIICVNDGSTDSTPAILHDRAARDDRIRVIDKPNGGYGSACNCGIEASRGEWIAIFEPDDWIEPGMYADMTMFADSLGTNIDIVKTPYWRIIDPDTPEQQRLNCSYKGRIRPKRQPFTLDDDHVDHLLIHHPSIWSALYRRSFLDEFGIRFQEIPGAGWADNPFLVETLCQARSIAYLDRAYYCYREETASKSASFVQRNADVPFARWHDMMDVLERIGEDNPKVLQAQFRRGFTYLDYVGEGIELGDPHVREIMERMFARMDDDLVFAEPNIPPSWKKRYQDVKGIPPRHVSSAPYAQALVRAGLYSLKNVGPAEAFNLIGSVMRRDKAAAGAGEASDAAADDTPNAVADDKAPAGSIAAPSVKLSVIVPVYNAQRFLRECLGSLESQTYRNLEIICVNDGSTDGSRAILEEFARADERIVVIDRQNGGPSSARNTGIAAATGDYLCFLDCDDIFERNACQRIAEVVSADAVDAVAFGWSCDPAESANRWLTELTCVRDARYSRFSPELLFEEKTNPYLRVAVRRRSLESAGVSFDESLGIGEDCAFLFALFPRLETTRLISDRLYRYRMPHEGSIMSDSSEGSPEKCLDDLLMAISIFGDWDRAGFLAPYGAQLVHWFVVLQLYTILRLPVSTRNNLVMLVKQLWRAHFTDDELRTLATPIHDKTLIEAVASAHDDGTLSMSENALRKAMLSWRNAEYGVGDLFRTAVEQLSHR